MSRGTSALDAVCDFLESIPASPERDRVIGILGDAAERMLDLEGEVETEYTEAERLAAVLLEHGMGVPD